MPDTIRTLSFAVTSLFQDGQAAGSITPQDMRDLLVSIAAGTVSTGRTLTVGATLLATDRYIFSNQSGAIAYTLAAAPVANQCITIKDIAGNSGANNITITPSSGTIDGAATLVIASNYASADLVFNGTDWSVV